MALDDTRDFSSGAFAISAPTFQTRSDVGVNDHLKYIAVSNQAFAVPDKGSLTFSSTIQSTPFRSEEHTSELQSLMRISYAVFCLKKKHNIQHTHTRLPQ